MRMQLAKLYFGLVNTENKMVVFVLGDIFSLSSREMISIQF